MSTIWHLTKSHEEDNTTCLLYFSTNSLPNAVTGKDTHPNSIVNILYTTTVTYKNVLKYGIIECSWHTTEKRGLREIVPGDHYILLTCRCYLRCLPSGTMPTNPSMIDESTGRYESIHGRVIDRKVYIAADEPKYFKEAETRSDNFLYTCK